MKQKENADLILSGLKKISPQIRCVFLGVFLFGLFSQGMGLFNKFSHHDDVAILFDMGTTFSSGRWMLQVLTVLEGKFYGTGRRKKSVARVYLIPGTGKITINKRDIDEYLGLETLKVIVRQPLVATDTLDKFDVQVNVKGGGYTGQAGAIRHGIARALLEADAEYRPTLKAAGYLTRDPRMKERKKYGLKGARRAPQFSKR